MPGRNGRVSTVKFGIDSNFEVTFTHNPINSLDCFSERTDKKYNLCEKAFFFSNEAAKLFGIIYLPLNKTGVQKKLGFVMCQPYLVEPLITQQLEVDIARSLAQAGFPVLRFHYRGCGDSEGDFKEVTLSSQISDTLQAIKVFTEYGKLDSVGLLGIRFGGIVALRAAEIEERVKCLVLCEPVIEPKRYFLDLLRATKFSAIASKGKIISRERMLDDLMATGSANILGYPLYKEIFIETESLNMSQNVNNFSGKTLLIQISTTPTKVKKEFQTLCDQIQKKGGVCDIKLILERGLSWNFILENPFRSEKVTRSILEWCEERIVCSVSETLEELDNAKLYGTPLSGNSEITRTENPVFIQSQHCQLFGILHTPTQSLLQERIVCIMLPGAATPRTHRNRMWVKLARRLADLGFFAFRFDYRGIGESTGIFDRTNIRQFAAPDLINVVNFITHHINPSKIIFIGSCFGAQTALRIIHSQKVHGLVLLAAPIAGKDGMMNLVASKRGLAYYMGILRSKTLRAHMNMERIMRNLNYIARRLYLKWKHINVNSLVSEEFSNQFSTIVNKRIPTLVMYGTKDECYENMKMLLQRVDTAKRENIEFYEVKDEMIHGLVISNQLQEMIIERILNWIESRYLEFIRN